MTTFQVVGLSYFIIQFFLVAWAVHKGEVEYTIVSAFVYIPVYLGLVGLLIASGSAFTFQGIILLAWFGLGIPSVISMIGDTKEMDGTVGFLTCVILLIGTALVLTI